MSKARAVFQEPLSINYFKISFFPSPLPPSLPLGDDHLILRGAWHFLEINILTLKMLEINNLSRSVFQVPLSINYFSFFTSGTIFPLPSLPPSLPLGDDHFIPRGAWHFLEKNILTLKMLEINNLSSSGKKINNLTLTC